MCGLWNTKMDTQETIEELTQICVKMRSHLKKFSEQKDKEAVILKHIKRFEDNATSIPEFQKGNYVIQIIICVYKIFFYIYLYSPC